MAEIIPFKTRQQLETEKAVKVIQEWESHLEWEEANWHHLEEREAEKGLSQDEIEWLNEWLHNESISNKLLIAAASSPPTKRTYITTKF